MDRADLHDYQRAMVDWLLRHPRAGLLAGMGLGKTVATLTALAELLDSLAVSKALIVAPKRVALSTWPSEFAKWDHLRELRYRVLNGGKKAKAEAVTRAIGDEPIHIISVDLFAHLVQSLGDRWPYDALILDESTLFKSHASLRFRALKKVAKRVGWFTILTGTPAPNGLLDLWAQTYGLDFGAGLGRTITAYRQRWFDSDYMGFKWTPKPDAQAEIERRLEPLCLSMTAADLFDLPPLVSNTVAVDLGPALLAQYRKLEREALLAISQETLVTATSAAALTGKCLQFTAGALYDEHGAWHRVHDAKLDALEEVIDSANGAPVVVAYQFKFDLARLKSRFPQAVEIGSDPATIDRWNAGRIPLLLVHPASAGHGIQLQHGGNILVFYSLGWSLEHYQQVIERLGPTRQKQAGYDRPVFIHHLIATGTLDEQVLERLNTKASVQDTLMAAMKRRPPA